MVDVDDMKDDNNDLIDDMEGDMKMALLSKKHFSQCNRFDETNFYWFFARNILNITFLFNGKKSANVPKPSLENYWYPRNKFYFWIWIWSLMPKDHYSGIIASLEAYLKAIQSRTICPIAIAKAILLPQFIVRYVRWSPGYLV